jgi:hypothetical protein
MASAALSRHDFPTAMERIAFTMTMMVVSYSAI